MLFLTMSTNVILVVAQCNDRKYSSTYKSELVIRKGIVCTNQVKHSTHFT